MLTDFSTQPWLGERTPHNFTTIRIRASLLEFLGLIELITDFHLSYLEYLESLVSRPCWSLKISTSGLTGPIRGFYNRSFLFLRVRDLRIQPLTDVRRSPGTRPEPFGTSRCPELRLLWQALRSGPSTLGLLVHVMGSS